MYKIPQYDFAPGTACTDGGDMCGMYPCKTGKYTLTADHEAIVTYLETEIAVKDAEIMVGARLCSNLTDRVNDLEAHLAEERAKSAWIPIDKDHLPRVGDEIFSPANDEFYNETMQVTRRLLDIDNDAESWHLEGWTHFRAIDPPEPSKRSD